jgi:putative hydrolase of the HAD superfamily
MNELLAIIQANTGKAPAIRPSPEGIRALIFDAGDILYHRPNRGREFRKFLTEHGLATREIPPAARHALKLQAYRGSITQDQFRAALVDLYGITDPIWIEQGKRALEADDNNIQVIKGVPETLKELKRQGYLLGIITDTANPLHIKLSWFEQGGFGHVWDSIISSQELGVQKPHPAIYTAALQQLCLDASQAVFVGHNIDELDGAHTVGMQTVAFNYDEGARADFYIKKFADLLKVPGITTNHRHKQG